MKRPLRPEETRLWAVVAATVRPSPGRVLPRLPAPEPEPASKPPRITTAALTPAPRPKPAPPPRYTPEVIEPGRKRRIARGRDEIAGRLDLHGYDQDAARVRLRHFLLDAQDRGARAVLVITGKGFSGQGVLRRRTPEWLADPAFRSVVAGLSPAEGRHGGEGAYYVALKRKTRG
jgi:DNA-nicking Smr family endonuclease